MISLALILVMLFIGVISLLTTVGFWGIMAIDFAIFVFLIYSVIQVFTNKNKKK